MGGTRLSTVGAVISMFFRMSDPNLNRRLNDLILAPSEDLDVEVKGWLDLSTGEHKATLAKALLALANHGGGFHLGCARHNRY